MRKIAVLSIVFAVALCAAAGAQISQPRVTMSITLPDGSIKEVTTRASTLARVKLADDREFAFRPSMLDDKGVLFTVTVFRMEPFENLGDTEVKTGQKPVDSKTMPVFKIAISKVQ
jgi:hypothetical protein